MKNPYRMTLTRWYGTSIKVPDYQSSGYTRFLTSCVGLVSSVCEARLGKKLYVRFMEGGTAAADQKNMVILLSQEMAQGRFGKRRLPVEDTISTILGILVHEAAHFAYSPATLVPWADHIKAHSKLPFVAGVARTLGNIIEDVYIEAKVGRKIPNLYWMLETARDVMFTEKDIKTRLKLVAGVYDAPTTEDALNNTLNALILAKLDMPAKGTPYFVKLFSMVREAETLEDIQDRLELGLEVYNELMRNLDMADADGSGQPQKGKKNASQESGSGNAGVSSQDVATDDDGDEEGDASGEDGTEEGGGGTAAPTLDEVEKASQGLNTSHDPEENEKRVYLSKPADDKGMEEINRSLEGMRAYNMLPSKEMGEYDPDYGSVIERYAEMNKPVQLDKRYVLLAEMGRQRATVNKPYGEDRKRGTTIRRLHRIATDGKIFAERVPMNDYKPMQVAILVDCSGSMTSMVVDGGKRLGSRMELAMQAALGACYGLMEARCEVALFGHTADGLMRQRETIIYNFKEFHQGMERVAERLGWGVEGAMHSNNRDGVAIKHVATKFTNKQRRRLMIVISDGSPSAEGWYGYVGRDVTAEMVKEVRQQGIDVLSISITEEARKENDIIYGAEHNVFNQDPNVIEKVIEKLLTQ